MNQVFISGVSLDHLTFCIWAYYRLLGSKVSLLFKVENGAFTLVRTLHK